MDVLIAERLAHLRNFKELSRSQLSRLTVREGFAGVPEATIKALEREPGRVPEARIIEALAIALEVSAESFLEYPIALARERAKQRGVGTPPGMPNELGRFDGAVQPTVPKAARKTTRPAQGSR